MVPRPRVPRTEARFEVPRESVHMDQFWPTKWIFLLEDTQRYIVRYDGSIEAIASVPHLQYSIARARILVYFSVPDRPADPTSTVGGLLMSRMLSF